MAKILIIDDEKNIRFTLEDYFSDEGFEVATAGDYGDAMKMIDQCMCRQARTKR